MMPRPSFLQVALETAAARLRPGFWRPDLLTFPAMRLLDELADLEEQGLLLPAGGIFVSAESEMVLAMHECEVWWSPIADAFDRSGVMRTRVPAELRD